MSLSKDRPQPGPGAPLTAERERYLRLVAQGMSNVEACREVGVHRTTGTRWRDGRSMVDSGGRARYYPPITAPAVAISPRYLSEDERVLIGDLLRAGRSVRSIATELGRSPVNGRIISLTLIALSGATSGQPRLSSVLASRHATVYAGRC